MRMVEAGMSISAPSVVSVRYYVFYKSVRTHTSRKIWNYHANAGGHDHTVKLAYDKVVVVIAHDPFPSASEMLAAFGNCVLVQMQVQLQYSLQILTHGFTDNKSISGHGSILSCCFKEL